MNGMISQTRLEYHGHWECMEIQLMGMGSYTEKCDNLPGTIMNDTFITGFYRSPKSFLSCTHVNSCQ